MSLEHTILIIDDQTTDLTMLTNILEPEYNVASIGGGKEVLSFLHENGKTLSAVILDTAALGAEGYVILDYIKHDSNTSHIPVIVAAQKDDEESEINALKRGASDFIIKPYRQEIVKQRLENLIKMHDAANVINIVEKDYLTGVLNKEAFCHNAKNILSLEKNCKYDMIISDIDHFKLINDTYGVTEGDNLLKYVSSKMQTIAEESKGICGRFGGDIFVMLIPRNKDKLETVLNELTSDLQKYPLTMNIKIKFGIYEIDDNSLSVISMCDRAMLAKKDIKNKYNASFAYYTNSIKERMLTEQKITNNMNIALKEDQFHVYLQGKYNLSNEKLIGAEALVRWIHPELGFLPPNEFIPLFESNGFITELDIYVWNKACEILSSWQKSGKKMVPVSVNVSRKDLYNVNLPDIISGIVKKHNIDPKYLHLEITETAYTENPSQLVSVVDELKEKGFVIEMDDFGSGYSSLNMLSEMPLDILKLDMKFLNSEKAKHGMRNIMSFVISLAKWLNLDVVAEGVETKDQINLLKSLECNYVQGFYFSKPIPNNEFTDNLKDFMVSENTDFNNFDGQSDSVQTFISGSNVKKMMIIDDMKMNREILSNYFAADYTIVEASNGKSALSYLENNSDNVEVIMLDLIMPVMDGYAFLKEIKNDKKLSQIPVIVISQMGETSESDAVCLGADGYISKPYNYRVAIETLNKVISEKKTQTQIG